MAGQPGFFDLDRRYAALSAAVDPLERLARVVDFELFRHELEAALARSDRAKGGRPPYDAVLMFKVLVVQTLDTQLTRAGAIARLFARFDAALRDAGDLAMAGQIVDASVIEARRPRLTQDEKVTVKAGSVPEAWSQAQRSQMDTDGRWTLKRGRQRAAADGSGPRGRTELVILCSATRTTSGSTAGTASSAASR